MSPRRNTRGSHRRTTWRPEPEQTEVAVNYEALARRLVRRGLASRGVLDPPQHSLTQPNGTQL
jgi:hypothetical protein